jgi:hypothetical protein
MLVRPNEEGQDETEAKIVLGEPLLKEYLTIFDLENERLGFFRIPIPPPPPAFVLPTIVPEMGGQL